MSRQLIVLLNGERVGVVYQGEGGQLRFVYNDSWRQRADVFPLSLSLPLSRTEHDDNVVRSYLAGLLPDNDNVLKGWGRRFGVSPRNPFALLEHVGEDCAGAVQFIRQEQLEAIGNVALHGEIQWITESDIAERIRLIHKDISAWRLGDDLGQFSLAGAQPKIALTLENGRWGVPSGRIPTTHILKPPMVSYDGFAENEHICLELARLANLPVVKSQVMKFEDQVAIVVDRYDRARIADELVRVHQEDMCQALGVPPSHKYESEGEGGPGAIQIIDILLTHSQNPTRDIEHFINALAFNWVIGGTDAHAKNYSILLGEAEAVRLAPLYDIVSAVPYPRLNTPKLKLAMKIGGEYVMRKIHRRHWEKLAEAARLPEAELVARVEDIAAKMPGWVEQVKAHTVQNGLDQEFIETLADGILVNASNCQKAMG